MKHDWPNIIPTDVGSTGTKANARCLSTASSTLKSQSDPAIRRSQHQLRLIGVTTAPKIASHLGSPTVPICRFRSFLCLIYRFRLPHCASCLLRQMSFRSLIYQPFLPTQFAYGLPGLPHVLLVKHE